MPLHNEFNKVMIIGAGPTIIGEVSEMDILGEQVLESFLEENIQVVLLNPNPATVETDWKKNLKVFLEPMTLDFTKRICGWKNQMPFLQQPEVNQLYAC